MNLKIWAIKRQFPIIYQRPSNKLIASAENVPFAHCLYIVIEKRYWNATKHPFMLKK